MEKKEKIFLSYSWKDSIIANEIDQAFQKLGIMFRRDIRDLSYKDNLDDFQRSVRKTEYALMLISDDWLKSINCIFEAIEKMKDFSYEKETLPVILDSANVFDKKYRGYIYDYWKQKEEDEKEFLASLPESAIDAERDEMKKIKNINHLIGDFFHFLRSDIVIKFSELKKQSYKPVLSFIGHDQEQIELFQRVLAIGKMKEKKATEIKRILLAYPNNPIVLFALGVIEKDTEDKLLFYDRALELNAEYSEVYNNRGLVKYYQGDFFGAISDFNNAIKLTPQQALAYNNRGMAKTKQGDLDGAISDYDEAIKLAPEFSQAYNNRGLARYEKSDLKGAMLDYDKAIAFNPEYANAYVNRGVVRNKLEDSDGAVLDYDKAIVLNANDALAYNNRGFIKSRRGDYIGAILDFSEAIRLNPKFAEPYYGRGNAKNHQDDFSGAIIDFDEAIRLYPEYELAYFSRGVVKAKLKDFVDAITDYDKVLLLNPENSNAYVNRGFAKTKQGDFIGAILDLNKGIALNPKDDIA